MCASRGPVLTKVYLKVELHDDDIDNEEEKVPGGPLDAGIVALLFRTAGVGVDIKFGRHDT